MYDRDALVAIDSPCECEHNTLSALTLGGGAHLAGHDLVQGSWSSHNIAITNIVWCMAKTRGVGGGAYIAQWPCTSIAIGYALQVGGAIQG